MLIKFKNIIWPLEHETVAIIIICMYIILLMKQKTKKSNICFFLFPFVIFQKITMPMEENKIVNEYTQDGSMDLKGKPVLRSKTGGWKACSFLVGSFYLSLSLFKITPLVFNILLK